VWQLEEEEFRVIIRVISEYSRDVRVERRLTRSGGKRHHGGKVEVRGKSGRRRPGTRTRAKKTLGEVPGNGGVWKVRSEWDELMDDVHGLVLAGDLSKSQAVMVDSDEEPVMERWLQRYGQEQTWTWNDPTRRVGWGALEGVRRVDVRVESEMDEEMAFGHWWK